MTIELKDYTIRKRYQAGKGLKGKYDTYNKLNVILYCNIDDLDSIMLVDIDNKTFIVEVVDISLQKSKGQYKAICNIIREVDKKDLKDFLNGLQ